MLGDPRAFESCYEMKKRHRSVCRLIKRLIKRILSGFSSTGDRESLRYPPSIIPPPPANPRNPPQNQQEIPGRVAVNKGNNTLTWQPGYRLESG